MQWGTCRTRCLRAALLLAALPACCSFAQAQCLPGSLFSPPVGYATGPLPRYLVAGDFNGDAVTDIVVANSATNVNTISILLGNGSPGAGDGTFRSGGSFDAGGRALGLAVGDFNGDAIRDLAVANGESSRISVLLGVGDGTFAGPSSHAVGASPEQLTVGDFNGDGIEDLAVVDRTTLGLYVLLGGGDGNFAAGFSSILVYAPILIISTDLSGDGILDLVFITTPGSLGFMRGGGAGGVGDGSFGPPTYYFVGPLPSDFAVLDFNSDGRLDVAVANRVRGGIYTLAGLGGGGLGAPGAFAQGLSLTSVVVSHFDDDAIPDLLATSTPDNQLLFLKGGGANGVGSGVFGAPVVEAVLGPAPNDLLVGDFNGDCANDVAAVNLNGTPDPPTGLSVLIARCVPATCAHSPTSFIAADRPDDQGGYVRLAWHRSILDQLHVGTVGSYQIWRQAIGTGATPAPPVRAAATSAPGLGRAGEPSAISEDWVHVADVPAVGAYSYSADVPTTRDSILGDSAPHAFLVRAVTSSPDLFYDSETLVLHSVDNLAPPAPQYVLAQSTPGGAIWLHWAPSAASDVLEYRVHRGGTPIFVPGPVNLIAVVPDTQHVDPVGPASSTYKVVAVDIHGNVGSAGGGAAVCAPPACSFTVRYPLVVQSLDVTAFDTTFTNAYGESFRAAYDLVEGWAIASLFGGAGVDITTITNDTYWIEGAPIDQAFTFNAHLQLESQTTQQCGLHCATGYVQASIAEVGAPSSPCPGSTEPCAVLTRRGYEPFRISVSVLAGVGGSVFAATAFIKATLQFSGLPPGAYVTSCSGYISDVTVPVQLSLVRASVESGIARLTWHTPDNSAARASVYRRTGSEDWSRHGEIVTDGSGYLVYEDRTVISGMRYGYRLGVVDGGEERPFGEAWVEIPFAALLALDEVAPNPATGPIRARFSLPAARPARLEVFDLSGRRVLIREVGEFGGGSHDVVLEDTRALRPGIYMLSLSQDARRVTKRIMKIR